MPNTFVSLLDTHHGVRCGGGTNKNSAFETHSLLLLQLHKAMASSVGPSSVPMYASLLRVFRVGVAGQDNLCRTCAHCLPVPPPQHVCYRMAVVHASRLTSQGLIRIGLTLFRSPCTGT